MFSPTSLLPRCSISGMSLRGHGKVGFCCRTKLLVRPYTINIGYNAPQNMQHYAIYLDSRIRAYRDMKHDAIAVQSEANRDLRLSQNIDAELGRSRPRGKGAESSSTGGLQRGKTIAGRKLRVMTVEKGLLRETKAVQKQIDTLVECRVRLPTSVHGWNTNSNPIVLSGRLARSVNHRRTSYAGPGSSDPFLCW
jgi:hypothetical protein